MFPCLLTSFFPSEYPRYLCPDFASTTLSCGLEGKRVGCCAQRDAGGKKRLGLSCVLEVEAGRAAVQVPHVLDCTSTARDAGSLVEETPLSWLLLSPSSKWECNPHPFSPFLVCVSILF